MNSFTKRRSPSRSRVEHFGDAARELLGAVPGGGPVPCPACGARAVTADFDAGRFSCRACGLRGGLRALLETAGVLRRDVRAGAEDDPVLVGARAILEHAERETDAWTTCEPDDPEQLALERLRAAVNSWRRCGRDALWVPLACGYGHRVLRPTGRPCGARGCPRCGEQRARRELEAAWGRHLRERFAPGMFGVIRFLAPPAWSRAEAHAAFSRLRRRSRAAALQDTIAVLEFDPDGRRWTVAVLARLDDIAAEAAALRDAWRALGGPDAALRLESSPAFDPVEALARLLLGAERAPLLVGMEDPARALAVLAEETGPGGGARHRLLVFLRRDRPVHESAKEGVTGVTLADSRRAAGPPCPVCGTPTEEGPPVPWIRVEALVRRGELVPVEVDGERVLAPPGTAALLAARGAAVMVA